MTSQAFLNQHKILTNKIEDLLNKVKILEPADDKQLTLETLFDIEEEIDICLGVWYF